MTDAAPILTPPTRAGEGPPHAPPAVARDLEDWALDVFQCRRCTADLARLSARARYCPRCGLDLSAGPVLPATPVDTPHSTTAAPGASASTPAAPPSAEIVEAVLAEWQRLQQSGALQAGAPSIAKAKGLEGPRSQIVSGYANALCRLGWRYESHLGLGRNVSEAVRCYLKAARLGNAEALARLAPQCTGPAPTSTCRTGGIVSHSDEHAANVSLPPTAPRAPR